MKAAWLSILLFVVAASPAKGQTPPVRSRGQLRHLPLVFDMGPAGRSARGALRCRADTRDVGYCWTGGIVKDRARTDVADPVFATFAESDDATFLVALEPPDTAYTVELALGDPERPRGPVSIVINGTPLFEGITTAAGEKRILTAEVEPQGGRLSIHLKSDDCSGFALSGLVIRGPAHAHLGKLFPEAATGNPLPPPIEIAPVTQEGARSLLRDFCDFLVENRPRQGGFSYHGAWYQNAYAIRTLMAGSRLLEDGERWRAPAIECLDAFVAQQGRDSNWLAGYHVRPSCHGDETADSSSANLADIGTMTTCLALCLPDVDASRRAIWSKALVSYADSVAMPRQMADGAFSNGRFNGADYAHPYTVATACQTGSLAALFMATQDIRFRDAAERGARWLADNSFTSDGQFLLHPHDQDTVMLKAATDFGNVFYVADALILTRSISNDEELCASIDRAMEHWFFGERGLQAQANFDYWWMARDPWSDSKMGGMLYALAGFHDRARTGMSKWLRLALGWMADPERRASIGITRNPATVRGDYALPATGYAGLGVAALLAGDAEFFLSEPDEPPSDSGMITFPVSNGN